MVLAQFVMAKGNQVMASQVAMAESDRVVETVVVMGRVAMLTWYAAVSSLVEVVLKDLMVTSEIGSGHSASSAYGQSECAVSCRRCANREYHQ